MAAISPEASLGQNGSPEVQSYSTVRRGSIIVRKYTLPEEPPVQMMTALFALTLTVSLVSSMLPSEKGLSGARGSVSPGRMVGE